VAPENLELVRRLYAAMRERDVDGVLPLLDPEAEWISDPRVGDGPVRGREDVLRFFVDRAEMFGELELEVERLSERGDKVVAFLRIAGRGQASGAGFEIRIGHVWTIREGIVVRGEGFGDRDAALAAAGIEE
jgi:ketosteroid isomerase-like protein